jgi:hypothetical protein
MRMPQARAPRGSQKWIQTLVDARNDVLNSALAPHLPAGTAEKIQWLSPLSKDHYAEYCDEEFLSRLGVDCPHMPLDKFWPARGPQWDALGRAGPSGPFILVEAKANIPEIVSDCKARSRKSLLLIRKSLNDTRSYLRCTEGSDWTQGFYQYANRLAHLYLLRHLNDRNAYLVFIYFLNDRTRLPTCEGEWRGALTLQKRLMGLGRHRLEKFVIELFIDTRILEEKQ